MTMAVRGLLFVLTLTVKLSLVAAQLQRPACAECIAEYTKGEDAGAYKDIPVPGCDGPCDCSAPASPCFDPKIGTSMKVGSPENQAACCALCTTTKGCVGWVIPSGVDAGTSQDAKPFCWLKHSVTPVDKAPNRAHGKCVSTYSCSANWGFSFLVWFAMCSAVYVGAGSVIGARTSGRAPSLRVHPHHSQWIDAAGLFSDGVAFARAAAQGRTTRATAGGGPYSAVRAHSHDDSGSSQSRQSTHKSKDKRSQNKKDRKEKSSKSGAPSRAPGSPSADISDAAKSVQQAATPAVTATAAGGGGRW